jgi:hypothetical protein
MNAGLMVLIATTTYAGIWVKFRIRKGWLEPEAIEKALKDQQGNYQYPDLSDSTTFVVTAGLPLKRTVKAQ